jgi:putative ABC transport system permease protein
MVSVLTRKLLRDLARSGGTLSAVAVIAAAGAACLVAFVSSLANLEHARDDYYASARMADFWVDLRKCPVEDVRRAAARIEGVADIRARIGWSAVLDVEGTTMPVNAMILSLPSDPANAIAGIVMKKGSAFSAGARNQTILSDKFARARSLGPGDTLTAVAGGQRRTLVVTGTADSPEFIYLVSPGSIAEDPATYGVLYVKHDFAEDMFGFEGACNGIVGLLTPEGERDVRGVLERLSRELAPFGVLNAYARKDQFSAQMIDGELQQLGTTSVLLPAVFFGIAAMVLNILMTRLAEKQRTVVGTLKAIGYGDGRLVRHFLLFGAVTGLAGGALGSLAGVWMTAGMTRLYRFYFTFPDLSSRVAPAVVAGACALSAVFAILGSLQGLRRVLRLHPAEAMRPQSPPSASQTFAERLPFIGRRLGFRWRMVLRNLDRHRARALIAVISAAFGASILLLAFGFLDSIGAIVDFQYRKVLRSDYRLTFDSEADDGALGEVRDLPGVVRAEPVLSVVCTFASRSETKRGTITGIGGGAELLVPRDADGCVVAVPPAGLLMADRMAGALGLRTGDRVTVTPSRGGRRPVDVRVAGTIRSSVGMAVYASRDWLNRILNERDVLNGVEVLFQSGADDTLRREFLSSVVERPGIGTVTDIAREKRALRRQMDGALAGSVIVMVLFAGVIFFGVTLNGTLVSLEERRREAATLLVMGYSDAEVGALFLRETLLVNLVGALFGVPLGVFGLHFFMATVQTDAFSFSAELRPESVLYTLLTALSFVFACHAVTRRILARLDWRESLNVRE